MVISQQAAEALAAGDLALVVADVVFRCDELVVETLVISLLMIVLDVLLDSVSQRVLAEKDYAVETFLLDRSHKPLGVGVQVRAAWRQTNRLNALLFQVVVQFETSQAKSDVNLTFFVAT